MFVSKFSLEDWQGTQNHSSLQPVECWPDIEAAIQELDGQRKTLVTLEAEGEIHMAIGGGPHEYIVYLTLDNDIFHYLVDPAKSDAERKLVVGGQEGTYSAKLCVGVAAVMQAAKTFAELGTMDRSVDWERDGVYELA
jgi:Immunity protein Imm1